MADSNTLTVTGTLVKHLPAQTGTTKTGSPWTKRAFVMQQPGQYDKPFPCEAFGDKFEFLDSVMEGEQITVSFNPVGREWNEKWFVSISAWKIDVVGAKQPASQPATRQQPAAPTFHNEPDTTDLPF